MAPLPACARLESRSGGGGAERPSKFGYASIQLSVRAMLASALRLERIAVAERPGASTPKWSGELIMPASKLRAIVHPVWTTC